MYHHPERSCMGISKIIAMVVSGTILAIIFGLFFGYFVELLWNWLMPTIFKFGKISYWQGFGLVLLARLIFGSGSPYFGKHHHHKHQCPDDEWGTKAKNREYYHEWWHLEGRKAFENYIAKVENGNGKEGNNSGNAPEA